MNLAKRIRDCRYAKGWGPDELASRAAISRTALYQIECGKTETPRAGTLRRIARALDVSIEVLLGNAEWDLESATSPVEEAYREPSFGRSDSPMGESPAHGSRGGPHFASRGAGPAARHPDLDRKFHELLASPLGEGVARIVEESHRLLPSAVGASLD